MKTNFIRNILGGGGGVILSITELFRVLHCFNILCMCFFLHHTGLAQSQNWWRTIGNAANTNEFIGTINNSPFIIKTNNAERWRITSDGKFGFGISAPQYFVDVNGPAKFRWKVWCDSLLECSALKVHNLAGSGNALLISDAQGYVSTLNLSGHTNDVLTGNGAWTDINMLLPPSLWQKAGANIYFNQGYVGIGTNNPLFSLDVVGDVRVSNNVYVGGGIVISDKVNAITQVTTDKVLATEATLNRAVVSRVQADSIVMDSSRAIYGNTIVRGDVKMENKIEVVGNARFSGQLTATQGIVLDNNNSIGMKYIAGSGGSPAYMILGKVGLPPPPANPNFCFTPTLNAPALYVNGGHMQLFWNNTSLDLMTDGANSLIESSGNGGLLLNYYCNKDVGIGGYNGTANLLVSGKIGVGTTNPGCGADIQPSADVNGLCVRTNHSSGYGYAIYAKVNNADTKVFGAELNNQQTVVIYGNGRMGIGTEVSCMGPNIRLAVNGHIKAQEIIVETTGWCDNRLKYDFPRMRWYEKERYIQEEGHLPELPSEKEVTENGIYTANVLKGILANTEDNTMDIIALYKLVEDLRRENAALKKEIEKMKEKIK